MSENGDIYGSQRQHTSREHGREGALSALPGSTPLRARRRALREASGRISHDVLATKKAQTPSAYCHVFKSSREKR